MRIGSRILQRQNSLRQSMPPESVMEHRHSYWAHQDYTIFGGDETSVSGLVYKQYGSVIRLDPIVLMFAVKAELHLTTTFAGGGTTYSVKLDLGTVEPVYTFTDAVTHGLTVVDISGIYDRFFPEFQTIDMGFHIKVSNAGVPVILHGASLRWELYEKDTYGDFEKPTSRLLINKSLADKGAIRIKDKEAESFEYLSGLQL